ncbi:FUSC family protein [Nocardioides sp. KR10-350]|uniref:FUSC family protein n=1 Tax=Nocardioides cheoyonin TaxID=3156615 RepID=UPI0032B3B444
MSALVSRLVTIGPHAGSHRIAVRATVSITVPLLVLLAADHLSWSIYAAFGAFTSLYGRERAGLHRMRLQLTVGAVQTAMVTLGVLVGLSGQRAWLSVPLAAMVAVGASALSARQGWHPPGSLFQVFGFAAVASIPAEPGDVPRALAVSAASALFAVAVGNVGSLWRRVRRPGPAVLPDRPIGGAVEGVWRYALQSGVGVGLAGALATGSGIGRPYWAMVSAVVPLAARALPVQLVRGLHRVVGTALGLALAWVILELGLEGIAVVVVVAAMQAGAELLVGRNYALALVFVTPLALLMVHLVAPVPTGELLADRGLETLMGVVVGLVVGYVSRPGERVRSYAG